MTLVITTNNVPRDVLSGYELTDTERASLDYIDWEAVERGEESVSLFRYRGEVFDLAEFTASLPYDVAFKGWDGYQSDSFFSGLVVRYTDNFERVIVGRYCA